MGEDFKDNIKEVHISQITNGDTILHDGHIKTVGAKNIKHDACMGISLFGDSYRLGTKPVKKIRKMKVVQTKQ